MNSCAGFQIKIYHSVTRNSVQKSVNATKYPKVIFKSAKSTNTSNWPQPNFI